MILTEEQRGTVGFDLEKARAGISHYRIENPSNVDTESALKELVDQANLAEDALAEIERLRAENLELQVAVFGPDGIRAHQACIIADQAASISELEIEIAELKADLEQSEICIQARLEVIDQQAAQIKSLKKEIRRLKHESKVEQELTNSYIKHLHEAEARIKELEEAHKRSGAKYAKIINELRSSVYANIPGLDVGKIGPDAKPRSWQITEERVGLLRYCLDTLLDAPDIEESPGPRHSIEMLRAMLEEAKQCE